MALIIVAVTSAIAQIGKNDAEIRRQYGIPDANGVYRKGDLSLTVQYKDGMACALTFDRPSGAAFSDAQLAALIAENSDGKRWVAVQLAPPTRIWKRDDELVFAKYETAESLLGIVTAEHAAIAKELEPPKQPPPPPPPARKVSRTALRERIEDSVLFPDAGNYICVRRWPTSPTICYFAPSNEWLVLFQRAVGEINSVLAASKIQLIIVPPGSANPQICFHIGPNVPQTVRRWDWSNQLTSAILSVSTARKKQEQIYQECLAELLYAIGVAPRGGNLVDSFYSARPSGTFRTALSAFDTQVIAFTYTHLPPGAERYLVRRQFDKHWR